MDRKCPKCDSNIKYYDSVCPLCGHIVNPDEIRQSDYQNKKEYKKQKPINKIGNKRICVSKDTYKKVYERDNGRCRLCGSPNIQLHHIVYRSENVKLIDDPDNCIMLCDRCHALVHQDKKKWQPYLSTLICL